MVKGCHCTNSLLAKGLCAFSHNITVRTIIHTINWINCAVPHGKIICMLTNCTGIFCTGTLYKRSPLIRIKFFSFEHIIKVLIAKVMKTSIGFLMVLVLL